MRIIINPGSEAPENPTRENARKSLYYFLADIGLDGITATPCGDDGEGRWDWKLTFGENTVVVAFPGCDPDMTRLSKPWVSLRLYVDGSSWLWDFALNIARDKLLKENDKDASVEAAKFIAKRHAALVEAARAVVADVNFVSTGNLQDFGLQGPSYERLEALRLALENEQ